MTIGYGWIGEPQKVLRLILTLSALRRGPAKAEILWLTLSQVMSRQNICLLHEQIRKALEREIQQLTASAARNNACR